MTTTSIGQPVDRQDGRAKVTGQARYAADYDPPGLTYAVPLLSTIAKGRVQAIHAPDLPGVLKVITHANVGTFHRPVIDFMTASMPGEHRVVLEDDVVHHAGQYIGLVVAETLEQAVYAAKAIRIEYHEDKPLIDMQDGMDLAYQPELAFGRPVQISRGDAEAALATSDYVVKATYGTPIEHHNPMETSATTAVWEGDSLTLYDATQWVVGARNVVAQTLGVDPESIQIISRYVGGGFGAKGFVWGHTVLAAVAARLVGRPVRLSLSRQAMFTLTGHRPETLQHVTLGGDKEGRLQAIRHYSYSQTSPIGEFTEKCGVAADFLYACPNVDVRQWLIPVNIATPAPMRAPGEAPGLFAFESALDELAVETGIDPVDLRIRNHCDVDPSSGLPFSSKHLLECYQRGRERFGWDRRPSEPRQLRDGRHLVGWGMATATYPAMKAPGSATVRLHSDGRVLIRSATQDIGTGTYTTMAQLVSDVLQIPMNRISMELGDSRLPNAPVSGGSMTTASVGPAVHEAATKVLQQLHALSPDDADYVAVLKRHGLDSVVGDSQVFPGAEMGQFSFHSFGAHFMEVRVDPDLGEVRVSRVVSVFDVGRVLNSKTARSQVMGGVIQGIGMTLMEETLYDLRHGRAVSASLGDYLVPVNADVPPMDILFVDEPDFNINSIGARGLGEIGITGVAAALSNAIWHATGVRLRRLPITPDKLLG